ncbi:MerR family transcriptional regulator [Capsulimonas corticalis]|nr:MerR family transcriptional regulator [Capsulimonas corticalis]
MQTKIEPAARDGVGLTVQEVARQSGLSTHTLRYYERIGLLAPIPRDHSSGHRRYSPDTIDLVNNLACLRAAGMSIDDMRRFLQLRRQGNIVAGEQKKLFEAHEAALAREMEQMKIRMEYVAGKVAYWAAVEAGDAAMAREIAAANQCRAQKFKKRNGGL